MELAIYFPNMEQLTDMDEALRFVDLQACASNVAATVFSFNTSLMEYVANTNSLTWMESLFKDGYDFSRLYFGQEFCQNLIPPPAEIEEAYYYSRQLGWDYTYVTGGYLIETGIAKVRANLERLASINAEAEVVFNDWGVLRMLRNDFPQFKPVLGRILNKQTRLNFFTVSANQLPILKAELQTPVEEIHQNQLRAYADISLSNPEYLEMLKGMGIESVDLDIVPQGVLRPEDGWGMKLGFYYPWNFIATGRNCPTAGTIDPMKTYQVTDKPCSRPCRKYNCSPNVQPMELTVTQRGPALFGFHSEYANIYFNGSAKYERLIYEPYIPL